MKRGILIFWSLPNLELNSKFAAQMAWLGFFFSTNFVLLPYAAAWTEEDVTLSRFEPGPTELLRSGQETNNDDNCSIAWLCAEQLSSNLFLNFFHKVSLLDSNIIILEFLRFSTQPIQKKDSFSFSN